MAKTNKGAPRVLCMGCGHETGNPIGPLSHVERCEKCLPTAEREGLTLTVAFLSATGEAQQAQ